MLAGTTFSDTSPRPIPPGVPRAGTRVTEKYVVEELLGVGGMGAVVAARRTWDNQRVAIKVMLAEEAKHDDSTRRFFREARAAGAIDSPHVAKLLDFGRLDDGVPFMVLELLAGEGLDQVIRDRAPLAIPEAVGLTLQAIEGVAEAHARGIVHRDIKPSNLFLTTATDGQPIVKVLDFGISKATMKFEQSTEAPQLTETDTTLGSPQYMSPEQLRSSKDVDARTDIWSLGLILYKLLTGRPAFEAPNVGAHFAMILADPPTRLRDRRPDAPAQLEKVILTCLAKDRDERWQDLGQLARALAPFGGPNAELRATRIVTILELGGATSTSEPRMMLASEPTEAPTSVASPAARRSIDALVEQAESSGRGRRPPSAAPPPELGELTSSAWSPVTNSGRRPQQMRRLAFAGIGLVLLLVAFGAGRLLQGSDSEAAPTPAATSAPAAPSAEPADHRPADLRSPDLKERWLAALDAGTIEDDELKKLEALCVLDGDTACVARARERQEAKATPPAASTTVVATKPTPKAPTKSGPSKPAAPKPVSNTPPPADKPTIKPKGPMVDTL